MRRESLLLCLFFALLLLGSHSLSCASATSRTGQQATTTFQSLNKVEDSTEFNSNNNVRDDLAVMAPGDPVAPEEVPVSNPTPAPVARPPHTDLPPVEHIAQQTPNQKLLKWYLIGGIAGGGLLLIIIIIIACCCICALDKRERIANSVRPVKTVKKDASEEPARAVPPTVAAAIAAAALQPAASPSSNASNSANVASVSSPSSSNAAAAAAASSSAVTGSSAAPQAPPKPSASSSGPNAQIALAALGSVRMATSPVVAAAGAQSSRTAPALPIAVKIDSSSESESHSSSSEESSEESEASSETSSSSEEEEEESSEEQDSSSDSESRSESESQPEETVTQLNYDMDHVDDQGFDDW